MIEVAYFRPLREGRPFQSVAHRLMSRSLTCYLLFVAITAAAFLTDKLSALDALGAVTFTAGGRFGVILKLYAVLFVVIALTLRPGVRWGAPFYAGIALIAWATKYLFEATGWSAPYLVQSQLGPGEGFGPATFLGLTLVAFGMLIGEALTGRRAWWPVAIAVCMACIGLVFGMADYGLKQFALNMVASFRWVNSPYYYVFGVCAASISLAVFWMLSTRGPNALTYPLGELGKDTLFVYGFGNILINLLPLYRGTDVVTGFALLCAFMVFLVLLSFQRSRISRAIDPEGSGLLSQIQKAYEAFLNGTSDKLTRSYAERRN
ncbi:hypothetical protein [Cognatiyoonia sp. IB215182]|uniref:hypothetical protein n=1 Tax=Cognatiyoonia sp. IB215182 TaxID=3097353 RepID=UPI0039B767E2